ncbi:uncharacterized protein LOC141885122 [Acropora palmata]|uniref:uncharacterized protein LOC141885122 n=1 Tax=Acropora palmata TaxID=6131 RepID=UPI003DA19A09
MHDLLEGVLQYECKEMLKTFINEEKYLTLDQLNRPSPISQQTLNNAYNSLKQKAAQMWCLARFLPLMIGSLVPEDDEHWQLFQILLEIMDVVLSPETTEHAIGVLEEHHYRFIDLYPGRSIIPKMHYMVHYPAHMYK